MSKKSKAPERVVYNPSSSITVNGQLKSSAKSTQNGANATYNMNPYEQAAYEYANKAFFENLPNINIFSDDTQKALSEQVKAYLNQGINTINSTYTPILRNMQNDIARRFGNTDNSIFMDNLRDIESKRADAISDLAQSTTVKRDELINNELSNRYDYLSFLNNYQNQVYANMLSTLGLSTDLLNTNNNHLNGTNTAQTSSNKSPLGDVVKLTSQILGIFK